MGDNIDKKNGSNRKSPPDTITNLSQDWNDLLSGFTSEEDEEVKSLADLGLENDLDFSIFDYVASGDRETEENLEAYSEKTPSLDSSVPADGAVSADITVPTGNTVSDETTNLSNTKPTEIITQKKRDPVNTASAEKAVTKDPTKEEDSIMAKFTRKKAQKPSSDGGSGKQPKKKNKSLPKKIIKLLLILLAIIIAAGIFTVGYIIITSPKIEPDNLYEQLSQSTILYDDQGEAIEAVSTKDMRTNIDFEVMPQDMKDAVIAIEDKTFYNHNGFNFVRILGAIAESVTTGDNISGTSTITQQLARNLYLTNERSMTRKLREAYYTVILERELTKDQILEAYLNTIYLGFNANGIQTASQAYFGCDASELSLAQCAVLASLPKNPNSYAPLKRFPTEDIEAGNPNIILQDSTYTTVYNDGYRDRQLLVLKFMLEQGYISQEEHDAAVAVDIKSELHPSSLLNSKVTSYFTDYCVDEVISDMVNELNMDEATATDMVYNGGLKIYSTLNVKMQQAAETEFTKTSNFPSISSLVKDGNGNIMNKARTAILMYNKNTYFNSDGTFTLLSGEYILEADGDLVILKDKRLNIYTVTGVSGEKIPQIEFKNLYSMKDGHLYSIAGGYLSGIEDKYLSRDNDGNAVISGEFLQANPDFFIFGNNTVSFGPAHYTLRQETIQPQGAMVVTDFTNGQIKVMVGGRSTTGRLLYNRADNPRQPGSSIKPIGVYGPAIQSGIDLDSGWTAGSTIEDSPNIVNGKEWPRNWNNSYAGWVTLRYAVQQSLNVPAVRLCYSIGESYSAKFLENNGISTLVREGEVNDMNAAALALGGMTRGISPLEMASAYGTFANGGTYVEPVSYIRVEDSRGNILLEKTPESHRVYDERTAFIMTDILRTTVSNGIAGRAATGNQPVAGKTGTTTDNYDAWFVGMTPQFAASVWIGNDVNIKLSSGSSAAASLWSKVMRQVCADYPYGSFRAMPEGVYTLNGEYYADGTSPTGPTPSSLRPEILYDENGNAYYIDEETGLTIFVKIDEETGDILEEIDPPEGFVDPNAPVDPNTPSDSNTSGGITVPNNPGSTDTPSTPTTPPTTDPVTPPVSDNLAQPAA